MAGTITALHRSPDKTRPASAVSRAEALESSGLEGDRHAKGGSRRALLLMEQEVLDRLGLLPGQVREQVTVRGVDLHRLASGTRLRIGPVVLEVGSHCAPCEMMDRIRPGLRQTLDGQRGRFVRVVQGGPLAVGDPVVVEPPA